jgi:hypothetical protein
MTNSSAKILVVDHGAEIRDLPTELEVSANGPLKRLADPSSPP